MLAQRGAAFEKVMDGTIPHMQVLREIMLDHLVENQRQPHFVGNTLCDLPAAGTHFPRHRNDRHDVLHGYGGRHADTHSQCLDALRSGHDFGPLSPWVTQAKAVAMASFTRHCADALARFMRSTTLSISIMMSSVDETPVATTQSVADSATVWNAVCRNGT